MKESEMGDPQLFDGLTAWFSSSVQNRRKQLWLDNDGEEATAEEAMFVFSEDSNAEDTKKLYNSPTYINDSLAVFHPSYIDECMDCGDMKKVTIGRYFLPPSDVYNKIKHNVKYCYEYTSSHPETIQQGCSTEDKESSSNSQQHCNGESSPQDQFADYVDIQSLRQVSGEISDFIVGQNDCHVQKVVT